MTKIEELAHEMARLDAKHRIQDALAVDRSLPSHKRRAAQAKMDELSYRIEELSAAIGTMQAETMADAAIHATLVAALANTLDMFVPIQADITKKARHIERLALGMVPILSTAAGLDMNAMGWDWVPRVGARRWAEHVGVTNPNGAA